MLHRVELLYENSIQVTYKGELKAEDALEICDRIIDIVKENDMAMNIIMDVNDGFAFDYLPIVEARVKLQPYLYRFNFCYVIGHDERNYEYAKLFFKAMGVLKERVVYVKDQSQIDTGRQLYN